VWAGLRERLETDTIIWALRNSGGDKGAVTKQLLSFLSFYNHEFSPRETNKLLKELAELRDEAEQEPDPDKLAFVKAVEENHELQLLTRNYRNRNYIASSKT
jgi:hypothetical protein